MLRRRVLAVAVAALAIVGAQAPSASAARHCRPVTSGDYRATKIRAYNVTCRSTRSKLRRWLRRGHLPRDSFGWYCWRQSSGRRACSGGNGGNPPRFSFRLRRR